jgi:hypothetical protein
LRMLWWPLHERHCRLHADVRILSRVEEYLKHSSG